MYNSLPLMIIRCNKRRDPVNKSYIKFIRNNETVVSFNSTETKEYKEWGGDGQPRFKAVGPEDPRLFEYQNELYLYYTMTNPKGRYPLRGIEYIKLDEVMETNNRGQFLNTDIFGKPQQVIEKNWLFLSTATHLLAVYSLSPFILADIISNTAVARTKKDYDCVGNLHTAHFGSNTIKIDINGIAENMFIFNEVNPTTREYHSYVGFIEGDEPFRLLRVTTEMFKVDIPHVRFNYFSSISIKGKSNLTANYNDTLIISGGVDDFNPLYWELPLKYFLNMTTVGCTFPKLIGKDKPHVVKEDFNNKEFTLVVPVVVTLLLLIQLIRMIVLIPSYCTKKIHKINKFI